MESFSTRGLPAAKKVSYWNEISSRSFAQMDIRPHDLARFDGVLRREQVGPMTLMQVLSAAVRIRHTREHIARTSAPSFLLLAPLEHDLELTVDRAPSARVHAGELCLLDHARPYELVHGDGMRTLCLDLPRHLVEELVPGAEELVGRLIRPDSAMARMLVGLMRELGKEVESCSVSSLSPAFGQSLLGLVTATCSSYVQGPAGRGLAARAKAYRAYIDAQLADPGLKPAHVASHFGISERYLRAVLSTAGEGFSAYVLRRRVARCARMLRDPEWRHRTITDIAFDAGFNNATHFGQAFKAHYGVTPREYRRGQ